MRRIALLAAALVVAGSAWGQSYRWVDPATGRVMVTDLPPPKNAKNVTQAKAGGEVSGGTVGIETQRAAANFPVTLFTSSNCVEECKQARELLNKRGVPFTEKTGQSAEEIEELKALVGQAYVPSLKVGRQATKGFNADEYTKLLDLAGYPKSATTVAPPPATSADKPK